MAYGLIYYKRKHWLLTLFKDKGTKLAIYPFPVLNRDGSMWQTLFHETANGKVIELKGKHPERKYEIIALDDVTEETWRNAKPATTP